MEKEVNNKKEAYIYNQINKEKLINNKDYFKGNIDIYINKKDCEGKQTLTQRLEKLKKLKAKLKKPKK